MLYNFKIIFLKLTKKSFFKKIVFNFIKPRSVKKSDDIRISLIKKFVYNKSFVDIGCMWRVNGFFSFFAEESGAKRIVAVDLYKTEEFLREKNQRNSKVEFIQGDIHLQNIVNRVGLCDIVFCSGVLYHTPNPVYFLSMLRSICKERLILATMVIPEMIGIRNTAIFYPFLDKRQRKIWNLGVEQKSITSSYDPESKYSNWFWGFSPSCVESMLASANFKIEERYIRPFQVFFVCSTI